MIYGRNIPGSYAILFFIALDFTFTTRHIHNRVLFLLWPSLFILSGAISNCPPFFPSRILDTFQPGNLIFQYHVFLPFHTVVLVLIILRGLLSPPASSGPQSSFALTVYPKATLWQLFFVSHRVACWICFLTRDWTPAVVAWSPQHWAAREFPLL